jgi:ATP-dependent protease HslVU (ClpYQ) peptidase subunit
MMYPYAAVGCGESYALGALHAMEPTLSPKKRITRALEAAAFFSNGVTAPFHIMRIKR